MEWFNNDLSITVLSEANTSKNIHDRHNVVLGIVSETIWCQWVNGLACVRTLSTFS